MSRKRIKVINSKWNNPTLTSMRETAFGRKALFEIKDTMERAARMRNDDELIAKAEAKRQAKLRKRAKHGLS